MSRQVILLKTVQEALELDKNNQIKQNILGCSFTSLKNTTGNLSMEILKAMAVKTHYSLFFF